MFPNRNADNDVTVEWYSTSQRDVVVDEILELEENNPGCGGPIELAIERLENGEFGKRLPGTDLWEVKAAYSGKAYRVVYALVKVETDDQTVTGKGRRNATTTLVLVLVVFQKQSQALPDRIRKRAESRLRAFKDRQ